MVIKDWLINRPSFLQIAEKALFRADTYFQTLLAELDVGLLMLARYFNVDRFSLLLGIVHILWHACLGLVPAASMQKQKYFQVTVCTH